MKLAKCILVIAVTAAPSAFAARNTGDVTLPASNSTCAHSKKNDSLTQTASNEYTSTVFGGGQATKREFPTTTPSTAK